MRAALAGEPVRVRNPNSIRPWQHVLNPLSGYLVLAQALCDVARAREPAGTSARPSEDARPVGWIVERLAELWPGRAALGARRRPASARGALSQARLLARAGAARLAPAGRRSTRRCTSIVDWYQALRDGRRHARRDARADRGLLTTLPPRHDRRPPADSAARPLRGRVRRPRDVAAGQLLPAAGARQRDGAVLPAARARLRATASSCSSRSSRRPSRSSPTTPTSPRTPPAGSSTAAATPSR